MQEKKFRKGPWLEEEDEQLIDIVSRFGEKRWDSIARASGLGRSGKSCRLRWLNYLRPNLKHGPISPEEEQIIFQLHERWGNKWSRIARRLPGRTDNVIKNYWRTYLRRKALDQEQGANQDTAVSNNTKKNISSKVDDVQSCKDSSEDGFSTMGEKGAADECLSSPFDALSNLTVASLPYETRMLNWNNVCDISFNSCFSYPSWHISEDSDINSLWEFPSSLWDLD